jgi:hypothetical protein
MYGENFELVILVISAHCLNSSFPFSPYCLVSHQEAFIGFSRLFSPCELAADSGASLDL